MGKDLDGCWCRTRIQYQEVIRRKGILLCGKSVSNDKWHNSPILMNSITWLFSDHIAAETQSHFHFITLDN